VREQQRAAGPVGGGLINWAIAHELQPVDLAKAVEREAARTTDIRDLAVRLAGPDPTMGAPWASFDGNRLTGAQMGPGAPASPFPLGGEPRQFKYRVGWNYPSPPDTDRGVDGELLRVLADSFDLLRLCIEIRKNDMCHLQWDVIPTEKSRTKREQWLKDNAGELEQIKQFFEWPEAYVAQDAAGHWVRRGKVRFDAWLGALLEDYFVGDWLTIWPRHLRSGATVALDRVDGMNVKPLLDLDGRTPEPPMPAYQQYLYGVPRASFTLDELLYRPRTLRNHSPFGFSHVEQMLVLVNLALRFQMWLTQGYTESSLPLGLLEFPENYSPDQIEAVVETLNQAISGLAGERQKFHGVPFGTKWNAIKPFEWDESFAQYLVEYTAAMFRLNAQKLGFMPGRGGQGLGGKGFAEQQAENDENKSTIPDARWVEGLMNEIIQRYFNRTDVEFVFTELQSDDEAASIEADQKAIQAGLKSWDQALEERGEEPVGITEPFFVAPNGVVYTVSDIKAIQDPESAKDYTRTPAPGLPIWEDPDAEPEPQMVANLDGTTPPSMGPGGAGAEAVPQRQSQGAPGQATDKSGSRGAAPREPGSSDSQRSSKDLSQTAAKDSAEKFDTSSGFQPRPTLDPRGVQDELRRWKRKSVKAWRNGKRDVTFDTEVVPQTLKTELLAELAKADDVIDVRVAFDHAIEKAAMRHPMGQDGLEWANYRHAEELERSCGTCAFFHRQDGGLSTCSMFDVLVDGDFTCEEWRGRVSQKETRNSETTHAGLVVRAADTGRVLMLQRSIKDEADPARGSWEFPGGGLDPGEQPLEGAIREWQEETGTQLPPGTLHGSWKNGIYEGHVYVVPSEQDVPLNLDPENRQVANPDDPDGDDIETIAWWAPSEARTNPALREECQLCDWDMIDGAVPGATFKLSLGELAATVHAEVLKAAQPDDDDTEREQRIKQLAAAAGGALAAHALGVYGQKVRLGRHVNDMVGKLEQHYRAAIEAGSGDAAAAHKIPMLDQRTIDGLARARAEAQRPAARQLVETAARDGQVKPQTINALARGAKPAYEEGFGRTVTQASPGALAVWHTLATDPCPPCEDRDGQVFTLDDLPGWPGDGDFGGDLCEGGPNDRCELEWQMPAAAQPDDADS
jgi:8-oxo-dGTP pyrophosphatase MutT (NUDIX family)